MTMKHVSGFHLRHLVEQLVILQNLKKNCLEVRKALLTFLELKN